MADRGNAADSEPAAPLTTFRSISCQFAPKMYKIHQVGRGAERAGSVMRILYAVFFVCLLSTAFAEAAQASLLIKVDRSQQRMRVYIDGELHYVWPVSTGRRGYTTPTGAFRPYMLKRFHRSSKYNNAPMPYSIFYRGGYAIHGTGAVRRLGRTASHGCIRLHKSDARHLFRLVKDFGKARTRIVVHR